jgi:hypothetical protein
MEQVAATLRELGIAPLMTEATVARQREMGELGRRERCAREAEGGAAMLEAIENALKPYEWAKRDARRAAGASNAASRDEPCRAAQLAALRSATSAVSAETPRAAPWSAARRGTSASRHPHAPVEIGHLLGLHRGLRVKLLQRLAQESTGMFTLAEYISSAFGSAYIQSTASR